LKAQQLTGGLAQAGQWLARKFVRIWKFIARPNCTGSRHRAKPQNVVRYDGQGQRKTLNMENY